MFSWAPWVTQVRTFEALRRLGWNGDYITWAHLEAEGELARLKDGKFYVIGANALFQDDLPIHREIADAVDKAEQQYPREPDGRGLDRRHGDRGRTKGAGWPATPPRCAAAMQNLKVDTKGLRGGPIEWTKDNHFRTKPVLSRLSLGPGEVGDRAGEGLDGLRREVMDRQMPLISGGAADSEPSSSGILSGASRSQAARSCSSSSTSSCWRRSMP